MAPISVLIMDSNPGFLRFVVQYLEEQNREVISVAGAAFRAKDALTLAAAVAPQAMLIGMSGPLGTALGLIADIRHLFPSLAIVAMSQLGSAGYAQAALAAGADFFVDKDRLPADLVLALCQAAYARGDSRIRAI